MTTLKVHLLHPGARFSAQLGGRIYRKLTPAAMCTLDLTETKVYGFTARGDAIVLDRDTFVYPVHNMTHDQATDETMEDTVQRRVQQLLDAAHRLVDAGRANEPPQPPERAVRAHEIKHSEGYSLRLDAPIQRRVSPGHGHSLVNLELVYGVSSSGILQAIDPQCWVYPRDVSKER